MATPKNKDKPEEKFIKDGTAAGDIANAGTDAVAGDAINAGTDAAAADDTNTDTDTSAGDAADASTDTAAGDIANAGTDAAAGDAADAGGFSGLINTVSGEKAMLDFIRSSVEKTEVSTDAKPHWFTVQVVRSPSGKRFRAGIEFTSEPKPYDFSLLSDEQIAAISADTFLRIKPIAPTGE
ncbi:hypothetical protein [Serratia marcescens]|uniref:hypothetical protein n=1 Tax=Serratia marcescens TaxID=615 RepID=UPI0007604490|nr:hypothetical protein [Serratia marcescens]HEJ7164756.1 hypothetical protein [Serratia marcescens]HEM7588728.1 hypothetical protein [Serratia marcescens]